MAHQGCGQAWGKLVKVSASPGSEILLINRECTVGRKKDRDLSFPANKLVSGNHCRITQDQNSGQVWLEDMSTNGTVINMSKVVKKQTHLLQNGDVIHFVYRKNEPEQNIAYVYQAIGPQESASQDTEVSESYGAFTPDSNEALSASDLHFKSMQRRDRHPAARFAQMKPRSHRQRHTATERHNPIHFQRRAGDFLSFLDPFGGDEENQAAGYEHPEDQGETEAAAAGHSETGELTGSFDGSEPGSPLPEPAAASASPAGPSASAAVPTVPPKRRAQRRPGEQPSEVERQLLEALRTRPEAPAPPPRSEDELFLLSLVPSLQSLPPQTKEFVKFQIHKLIYESSTVPLNLEQLEPKEQF